MRNAPVFSATPSPTALAMVQSVMTGRCGPCCSMDPTGIMARSGSLFIISSAGSLFKIMSATYLSVFILSAVDALSLSR